MGWRVACPATAFASRMVLERQEVWWWLRGLWLGLWVLRVVVMRAGCLWGWGRWWRRWRRVV